jgi:Flp pilus assembly protein TadB
MDPLTIGVIVAGLASAAAGAYGAYSGDKQADKQRKYAQGRDALADKRQAEQDRIAASDRQRQAIMQMLDRSRQQRQQNAAMWHPPLPQQQAIAQQQAIH